MSRSRAKVSSSRAVESREKGGRGGKTDRSAVYRRLGGAILTLGLLAAAAYGLSVAELHAREIATSPTRIEWVDKPPWLESDYWRPIIRDLEAGLEIYPDTQIFDWSVCAYVGENLRKSPWIDQLSRVSKTNDGRIRVHAVFRRPFTLIEHRDRAYLVDEHAVRLPVEMHASAGNVSEYLPIRGVKAAPPVIGQVWRGDDVVDGIKLVRFLQNRMGTDPPPIRAMLRAVDLSNHDRVRSPFGGKLTISTTQPGGVIHWGLPPGEEYNIEATSDRKWLYLTSDLASQWVSEGSPIDLRDPNDISRWTRPDRPD